MKLLDWNPAWETGIEKIDQQHRELFGLIENLMKEIHNNQAASRLPGLLTFLAQYVDVHFRDEEAEMEASGYPRLASHKAIHDEMRARVATLELQFREDPTVLTDPVLDFVTDWLVNHINGEDRRMALHLLLRADRQAKG